MRRSIAVSLALVTPLGALLLLASALPAAAGTAAVTPLPPVVETDGYAGACYSFYPPPHPGTGRPYLPLAINAGARWDRFDFTWPVIEPENDTWDYAAHDDLVDDLHAAGMENLVGILLWTPDWASSVESSEPGERSLDGRPPGWYAPVSPAIRAPRATSAWSSPPAGLYLAWDDPNNHWGDYVTNVVSHFGDRVKYWEMWNEPELSFFWTGTSTDYAQLLKVGYQAAKAACGDCTVLFAGLHYWANTDYYWWVLAQLGADPAAAANNHFFDVMSVHIYSRSSDVYDVVNTVRSGMTAYSVGDHPIWLTETGSPVWNDAPTDPYPGKYEWAATLEESAAYVIQSYANARAAGVERYFFFRVNDADMVEYFGLVRNDETLRPSYVAFQVATTYLVSPTMSTSWTYGGGTRRVTLWGTPRGKVSVLWNTLPTAHGFNYPATMPTATMADRWGVTSTITAAGGVYGLTLPQATANMVSDPNVYIIGGEPLLVIESETVNRPPTCTVRPLPALTPALTSTVSWEGEDDEAGVWLYDVQVRDGASGDWTGLKTLTTLTSTQFTGEQEHTYYYRARAWDRLGNRGEWPETAQAWTTISLTGTLRFSAGAFFADENHNDAWDTPISSTGEVTLTQVTLTFRDEAGHDVVSATVGSSWEFTTTIYVGQTYELRATSAEHMRVLWFDWPLAGQVYTETYPALGLYPTTWVHLPLVMRGF